MLISELSPKARELVRLGRAMNQPRVADRERIQDALRARLGAAALPAEPSGAQRAARVGWPSGSSVIVGAVLDMRGTPRPVPSSTASSYPRTSRCAPLAPHVEDRLAEEVAFRTRVAADLSADRTSNALKVLDEYQRKFPNGLPTEEWRAARAQALCSLGRRSEAQAELARLATQPLAAARPDDLRCALRSGSLNPSSARAGSTADDMKDMQDRH